MLCITLIMDGVQGFMGEGASISTDKQHSKTHPGSATTVHVKVAAFKYNLDVTELQDCRIARGPHLLYRHC